jgi:adenylyl-sulfate kinase
MNNSKGFTVWFTGLPGAGKSTLARLLEGKLRQLGLQAEILDGDEVRKRLTKGLGFTREDREENIRRIAYVANLLTKVGGVAIVAAISPYAQSRDEVRSEIENFVEVFVKCSLKTCIERDPKGLDAKAQRGEISHFTGISDPYEEPKNPEIIVETDQEQPDECLMKILSQLEKVDLLKKFTEA